MKIPLPRSVLNLTGLDSIKFLNGICTQTIPTPSDGGRYAAFLTPQGRMLYDTFIYPYDNNSYYLEVDNRVSDSVLALCKKYQLRSKVRLHKMDNATVYASNDIPNDSIASMQDPRIPSPFNSLANRIISTCEHTQSNSLEEYTRDRYKLGIPEGIDDIWPDKSLPLECNLDYMNGVNFRKGCYVGQELTIRTHHTGVVRKRVLPMKLTPLDGNPDGIPAPMTNIYAQLPTIKKPKQAGKLCTGSANTDGSYDGIGLFRLEMLVRASEDMFVTTENGGRYKVNASIPSWWPHDDKTEAILNGEL
ncbi:Aminomethyltransferase folate-binding domain-containing protein [Wallemia mellicola]|uniref:Aminomethyltransferase folate-binding domain-containing protein n=1 Tax=Wallemia mellicola TaxID=1708541 RepID=A0A4T0MG24_9BASI|nr:Aminomethyltransferase folate-binding domain-containing protein [Wallemia mellicola]